MINEEESARREERKAGRSSWRGRGTAGGEERVKGAAKRGKVDEVVLERRKCEPDS